jgi:hypothetical protein
MLDEKSIKIFSQKLFIALNFSLPGIFVLELFFKKGIFSNSPQTLYEFTLLILWAFILSLPYNIIDVYSIEDIYIATKKKALKNNLITPEFAKEVEKKSKKYFKKHRKSHELTDSQIHFVAINIYLLITFFAYKYLDSHYFYHAVWNIGKSTLLYLNTLLVSLPIIYTLTLIIGNIMTNYYAKDALKNTTAANTR